LVGVHGGVRGGKTEENGIEGGGQYEEVADAKRGQQEEVRNGNG